MINAKRFGLMKANAILVNTSSGPVIKEDDLAAHFRTHPDVHAGPDVSTPPCKRAGIPDRFFL